MDITEDKLLWTVKETCQRLGLGRTIVMRLTYSGKLPSVKIGRRRMYIPDKVKAWAENNSITVADVVEATPAKVQSEYIPVADVGVILNDAGERVPAGAVIIAKTTGRVDLLEKKFKDLESNLRALAGSAKEAVEVRLDYLTISQLKELEERVTSLEASTTKRLHTAQQEIYEQIALLTVLYDRVAPLLEVKKTRWSLFGRLKKGGK